MKRPLQFMLLLAGIASVNPGQAQENSRSYPDDNRGQNRPNRQFNEQFERALIRAYKAGYEDAQQDALKTIQSTRIESDRMNTSRDARKSGSDRSDNDEKNRSSARKADDSDQSDRSDDTDSHKSNEKRQLPYKAFTGGFYAGVNSTRYRGEDVNGQDLTGRLGYQVGVFTRFGGRLYGQLGVEYFASSSNFFSPGDGQQLNDISGRIDTKWIQVPVYLGFKLAQSKRGISGVRLAVGAEYANRIGGTNTVQVDNDEIKNGTFLALGNLGFDLGPLMIDVVYHHGLSDVIQGFNNSQRRSVGLNVGFKF